MIVWLVESGDYEDRGVDLIAESPEAAVEALKAMFPPPYRVEWSPIGYRLSRSDDCYIVGMFDAVQGHSSAHTRCFEMRPMNVAVPRAAVEQVTR